MTTPPNFTKYSQEDLEFAFSNIDRNKFPKRYQECIQEIDRRKTEGKWVEPEQFNFIKLTIPICWIGLIVSAVFLTLNAYNFLYLLIQMQFLLAIAHLFLLALMAFYSGVSLKQGNWIPRVLIY